MRTTIDTKVTHQLNRNHLHDFAEADVCTVYNRDCDGFPSEAHTETYAGQRRRLQREHDSPCNGFAYG